MYLITNRLDLVDAVRKHETGQPEMFDKHQWFFYHLVTRQGQLVPR